MKQRYLLPFWCMRNSFKEVALATKAKNPARTQRFFQFQMVARGRIDQYLGYLTFDVHHLIGQHSADQVSLKIASIDSRLQEAVWVDASVSRGTPITNTPLHGQIMATVM